MYFSHDPVFSWPPWSGYQCPWSQLSLSSCTSKPGSVFTKKNKKKYIKSDAQSQLPQRLSTKDRSRHKGYPQRISVATKAFSRDTKSLFSPIFSLSTSHTKFSGSLAVLGTLVGCWHTDTLARWHAGTLNAVLSHSWHHIIVVVLHYNFYSLIRINKYWCTILFIPIPAK